jgi:hypothetical protein
MVATLDSIALQRSCQVLVFPERPFPSSSEISQLLRFSEDAGLMESGVIDGPAIVGFNGKESTLLGQLRLRAILERVFPYLIASRRMDDK